MNLKKLSESLLEQALTEGIITLQLTAVTRKVTTQQILQLAKEIVTAKVVITSDEPEVEQTSLPDEFYVPSSRCTLTEDEMNIINTASLVSYTLTEMKEEE